MTKSTRRLLCWGVPGGGSFAGANGGQIEWTGPPFKVRATCSCRGKTPT